MVENALVTRVRLTGMVARTNRGPGGSAHWLRVCSPSAGTAGEQWFLQSEGFVIGQEGYHALWPEAMRPGPEEALSALLDRLEGHEVTVAGVLVTAPWERPLVCVRKVQVAALQGHGLGLDTLRVRPQPASRG